MQEEIKDAMKFCLILIGGLFLIISAIYGLSSPERNAATDFCRQHGYQKFGYASWTSSFFGFCYNVTENDTLLRRCFSKFDNKNVWVDCQ